MAVMNPNVPLELPAHTEPRPNGAGTTLHSIQCLRAIAATIVVAFHAHISFMPPNSPNFSFEESYLFGMGKVGVHIFFVISGYIMYISSFQNQQKLDVSRFFMRRLLRIYPVYWIFVALYLSVAAIIQTFPNLSTGQFLGMLLLMPDSSPLVIGPAWTLSYEVYFYLIFGIVMQFGPTRGLLVLTGFFFASIVAGMLLHPQGPLAAMVTNGLLLEFVMGVWIGRLSLRYALPKTMGRLALCGAIGGYTAGFFWGYDRLPSALIWGVPSAMLVMGAVILEQRRTMGLSHPVQRLSWLGDSSYSLYLCHILLITLVITALKVRNLVVPVIPLSIALTIFAILFAILFYNTVERKAMAALYGKFLQRKTLVTPVISR
jgi:exopolysaccharide production protein ExoZ